MRVGVLALQGDFAEHEAMLAAIGSQPVRVRRADDLAGLAGLILPGGESSTLLKQLDPWFDALQAWKAQGKPILVTCAGLILAATSVRPPQRSLGWLDIGVVRNGYGGQQHSFEATSDGGRALVCIRAPRICSIGAAQTLDTLDGEAVLVRQDSVWGATFHPELTSSTALHTQVFGGERTERCAA